MGERLKFRRHLTPTPTRWLVLVLVWAGWCWFFVRGKHYWLASLGWLKPTSEHAVKLIEKVVWHKKTIQMQHVDTLYKVMFGCPS